MSKPEFRLTPQMAAAIALIMLAMGLPLLCLALALSGYRPHLAHAQAVEKREPPPEALQGLRNSLEKAADQKMPPVDAGLGGMQSVSISVADLPAAGKRVQALVKDFNATGLPPEETAKSVRIVAEVDTAWQAAFATCVRNGTPKPATLPPQAGSGGFCEIVITRAP